MAPAELVGLKKCPQRPKLRFQYRLLYRRSRLDRQGINLDWGVAIKRTDMFLDSLSSACTIGICIDLGSTREIHQLVL